MLPHHLTNTLFEGIWLQEGHFVQFRMGDDDDLVWVDEALDSPFRDRRDRIVTNIYNIPKAIEFQHKLAAFGYEYMPALELATNYFQGVDSEH